MAVSLIDGNSYYRKRLELATFGQSIPRLLFMETFLPGATKIWCWDPGDHYARRQKIYPAYKTNRPPLSEPIAQGLKFFRELMAFSAATQVRVPTYEADDVIAELTKRLPDPTIYSGDWDLCALGVPVIGAPVKDIPVEHIHLYKTLVGDPSDRISGIPGFGKGAWEKLTDGQKKDLNYMFKHRDTKALLHFPWPRQRGVASWVGSYIKELLACWEVSDFLPVSDEQLSAGITVGSSQREVGDAMLKQYFL